MKSDQAVIIDGKVVIRACKPMTVLTSKEKLIADLDWLKDQLHHRADEAFRQSGGKIDDPHSRDLSMRANEVAKLRTVVYAEHRLSATHKVSNEKE